MKIDVMKINANKKQNLDTLRQNILSVATHPHNYVWIK